MLFYRWKPTPNLGPILSRLTSGTSSTCDRLIAEVVSTPIASQDILAIQVSQLSEASKAVSDRSKPTLLKGFAQTWKATTSWKREAFLENFGHLKFKLRPCASVHEYAFTSPWKHVVSLSEYFTTSYGFDEAAGVIFENNYIDSSTHQALWDGCTVPSFLREIHADPIFSAARKNTYVGFHRHEESWLAQISGRKAWWLAPPCSDVPPICEPWKYAQHRPDGVLLCVTHPGDIIFLPEGWWHATWNLDDFVIGIGWEGGPGSAWHDGLHAIADGDLQKLVHWRSTLTDSGISKEMLFLAARAGHASVMEELLSVLRVSTECNQLDIPDVVATGAAISGHLHILKQLESHLQSKWHPWVLHGAVLCGHEEIVAWLLQQGADARGLDVLADGAWVPDYLCQQGEAWTPLHTAAWNGHCGIVEQLLHASADPSAKVNARNTFCVPQGRPGIGTKHATALHLAARRGHASVVMKLVSAGSDVSSLDDGHATALHRAAQGGHVAVLQVLIDAGADIRAEAPKGSGWTARAVASASGQEAAAELLDKMEGLLPNS